MRILKIELNNFRQFVGKNEIVFSNDSDKNITFIMAPNGSGKTTIIEAFRFLFFGKTEFKPNPKPEKIINTDLSNNLKVGENYEISVVVNIEYNKLQYEIRRNQKVSKGTTKVSLNPSSLHITFKDKNGKTQSKNEINAINFIREIMPEDLFDYFFFRGEDISKLGKSLFEKNLQQSQFEMSIKKLLGFTYLFNMKGDLEKVKRKFDLDLKDALQKDASNKNLQNEIISLKNALEKLENDKAIVETEINALDKRLKDVNTKLSDNKSTTEMQAERQKLKQSLLDKSNEIRKVKQDMFKTYSESGWYLFASKLFDKALSTIDKEVLSDEGIPGINIDCLKYIFEHKKCICGNEVISGSQAFKNLKELEKLIPPESIGNQIAKFKDKIDDIKKRYNLVYDSIKHHKETYNKYMSEYNGIAKAIDDLDERLKDVEDMSSYAEMQKKIEHDKGTKIFESGKLAERIKTLKETIEDKEKTRSIKNDNVEAKFIEKCMIYTKKVSEKLTDYLNLKQETMRKLFEDKINDIHKTIFKSKTYLKLRDDYSLLVLDENNNDVTNMVGQGGAESTIIAFAFIGAVMSLSQEQILKQNDEELGDDEIESYPLVLDAPSSTMDTSVIDKFFEKLPKFAEQTLILTKDTDGNYVEEILKSKIGKRYEFVRKNDFCTKIIGG